MFNPNLVKVPAKLFSRHPAQDGSSVSDHINRTQFYYQMLALIDNQEKNFDDINTQDIMAHNMDHGDKIIIEIDLSCDFNLDRFF